MKGYTAGLAFRRGESIPYIEIWTQPFFPWLIAAMYRFWESCSFIFMVPISKWHRKFWYSGEGYVPLLTRQDTRQDKLTNKNRISLAIVYTTQEQHKVITGQMTAAEVLRYEVKKPISPELVTNIQE